MTVISHSFLCITPCRMWYPLWKKRVVHFQLSVQEAVHTFAQFLKGTILDTSPSLQTPEGFTKEIFTLILRQKGSIVARIMEFLKRLFCGTKFPQMLFVSMRGTAHQTFAPHLAQIFVLPEAVWHAAFLPQGYPTIPLNPTTISTRFYRKKFKKVALFFFRHIYYRHSSEG